MSNTTVAYHKAKPTASILNSPNLFRYSNRQRVSLVSRAGSSASARSIAIRLLLTALILVLAGAAQAQRQAAATHIVRPGETLGIIAQNYGVDIYTLASANGISNAHLIYTWQELTIPSAAGQQTAVAAARGTHIVRYGETLDGIAKSYGIALSDLMALNNVFAWIYPGDELKLPAPGRAATPISANLPTTSSRRNLSAPTPLPSTPANQPVTHVVQRGETLFRIALRYGISADALLRANDIEDPRFIHAGNVLRISGSGAVVSDQPVQQPAPTAPNPVQRDLKRKQYLVQRGDTLSMIGARLNMSWQAIAHVNGISNPNALYVGVNLLLPTPEELAKYSPDNSNARTFFSGVSSHPGPRVGVGREIVVQLSTQTAYAYENGVLQKRALISSGLPETPTVQGDFKVTRKVRSQTMIGPDYNLENVEWVTYFYSEYALHGTYWHYNFGEPMSHGCVNMTNADAKWFYDFASIGTPVQVRFY